MHVHKRILTYVLFAAVAVTGLQCSDDDSGSEPKSTDKSITSFKFAALTPAVTATVNESAKTVSVNVPAGTNVTALVPTVELSASATVNPASGAAQNFTTPVTYTVTAEDGTKQAYVVTVTVEKTNTEATCYPTSLPASDAMTVDVTYTANHQVAAVKYTYTEDDEVYEYRTEHEYTSDGKINRINYFQGDDATFYIVFTYGNNTITEDKYEDVNEDGVYEKTTYFIYTLTNGRVTSWEYHLASREPGETRVESATYTYTGDNVTMMEVFDGAGTPEWHHTYTYDTKTNPFYQSSLNGSGSDDGYFVDVSNLSKNNVVFWDAHSKDYTETISFTYDNNGLPLTKKINDDVTRSFEYECK